MALQAQPTQRALKKDEIFICNTSNIDSMRHGRPETVMFEANQIVADKPVHNGVIVALGGTKQTSERLEMDHVREVATVGTDSAAAGKFIIVSPEINVEQYRRIDNSIANHILLAEETYTAYELQLRDRIEFSEAHLKQDDPELYSQDDAHTFKLIPGDTLEVNADGKLIDAGTAGSLRVVSVRPQRQPLMMALGGQKMPEAYQMIKVEVVK